MRHIAAFLSIAAWRRALLLSLSLPGIASAAGSVVTDGTLGVGPAQTINGPAYAIMQSHGTTVGTNLFHSFSTFNIGAGEAATFSAVTSISNVIARVTGGAFSTIDGTLASTIFGANLFLINPQGILFGPNASLNITGSFHASTANYLKLGAAGRFDATTPGNSVLTTDAPSAFGFIGPSAGGIAVIGSLLEVPAGQTMSFVAGEAFISGAFLSAPAGRVNLASVASAGEVMLNPTGITTSGVTQFGLITVNNTLIFVDSTAAMPSGAVAIRGGQLVVDGESWIRAQNSHAGAGGDLQFNIAGAMSVAESSFIESSTSGVGPGANIGIQAGSLSVTNGGQIFANTSGPGQGGNVAVAATGAVTIAGADSFGRSAISSQVEGTGNAGAISVNASNLTIDGGSLVSVSAAPGHASNINLQVGALTLSNAGQVRSNSRGAGNSGSVTVASTGPVIISGPDSAGVLSGISTVSTSTGNASPISITAPSLSVDEGVITARTFGSGSAGDINLDLGGLSLIRGGQITAGTDGGGQGGSLVFKVSGPTTISGTDTAGTGSSGIFSPTHGAGNAGNINLHLAGLSLSGGALINASTTGAGQGGSVVINSSGPVSVSGQDSAGNFSGIGTSAGSTSGNAGSISIIAPSLSADLGVIQSLTEGAGSAGSIAVQVDSLSLTAGAQIDSSTRGAGSGASVTIIAGAVEISGEAGGASSGVFASTDASGNAGNINLRVGSLSLTKGGTINASTDGGSSGRGGSVIIDAIGPTLISGISDTGSVSGIFASTQGSGNAGDIILRLSSLSLTDGGLVSARTFGAGRGGSITIDASNLVSISGVAPGFIPGVSASTFASGNAGSISIITPTLSIGGGGGVRSISSGSGAGGNIGISANDVTLSQGGFISTESLGSGNAGDINVTATNALRLLGGSEITTAATQADGGNIHLTVANLLYLQNSKISTSVGTGQGNGGNIIIDPIFLILDHSSIRADAFGGNGGNIDIVANNIFSFPDPVSRSITASSQLGISGTITISGPVVDITGGLLPLPAAYLNASSLLAARCAARIAGKSGSLVLAGRGGMPIEPDGQLPGSASAGLPYAAAESGATARAVQLALGGFAAGCAN